MKGKHVVVTGASSGIGRAIALRLARDGARVTLLAGTPAMVRPIRWRPASSLVVYNGDIECRLLSYDVPG